MDGTIVALSTPPGRGALAVIRLSGADAQRIAAGLSRRSAPFPIRRATLTRLDTSPGADNREAATAVRDDAVVTVFAGPQSYTGEDVAEISCHGSPVVLEAVLRAAVSLGARLAEPGEFTLRAFLNGRLDLVQAEAVADLVNAVTPRQARSAFDQLEGGLTTAIVEIDGKLFNLTARLEASLDFPDEGYHFVKAGTVAHELNELASRIDRLLAQGARGRILREGAVVAIAGCPNVGKSSLFNTLLRASRAIVSAAPGTTRDLVTERADVGGVPVRLVDTAGLRETSDDVEREGVTRARAAMVAADLTIVVLDSSRPLGAADLAVLGETRGRSRVVLVNKVDLPSAWTKGGIPSEAGLDVVFASLKTGEGVDTLEERLQAALAGAADSSASAVVTNVRHLKLLERARASIGRAVHAIETSNSTISEEFVLVDLQDARTALEEISGRRSSEDLLRHIFENFCIGK